MHVVKADALYFVVVFAELRTWCFAVQLEDSRRPAAIKSRVDSLLRRTPTPG